MPGMHSLRLGLAAILVSGALLSLPAGAARVLAGNGWSSYGQLSPEQQRELQKTYADYSGRLYELKSEIAARQAELEARLAAPSIDPQAIEAVVGDINSLRSEFFTERVQMIIEMRQKGLPFFGMQGGPGRSGFLSGDGFVP